MSLPLLLVRLLAWTLRRMTFAGCYAGREREVVTAYVKLRRAAPTNALTTAMFCDLVCVILIGSLP